MNSSRCFLGRGKAIKVLTGAVASLMFMFAGSQESSAVTFELGSVKGSFDSTVSVGARWRVEDRNPGLVGIANGGEARSVNGDDGNLNYGKQITNLAAQMSHELALDYNDKYGVFFRGSYFYDSVVMENDFLKEELTDQVRDMHGQSGRLLDAYAYANFEAGDAQIDVRVGNQVLNWGESTFMLNGLNQINPIDVSKLRVPGAELKDALTPVALAKVGVGYGNIQFNAFYQLDWEETIIDGKGTYFSSTDALSNGGRKIVAGFGSAPDSLGLGTNAVIGRITDENPDDEGQFGVNLSWYLEDGTELGFYYMNVHSKLPIISFNSGSIAGAIAGDYLGSIEYFAEYPEEMKIAGLSFNTQIGDFALQGEISHQMDVPAQIDDVELIYASICPPGGPTLGSVPANAFMCANNQVGNFADQFETYIQGFKRIDVTQMSLTGTRIFGNSMLWDQAVFLAEIGVTKADIPDQDELRMEASGTSTSANAAFTGATIQPVTEDSKYFPDEYSYGYKLLAILNYNRAIGNVNLVPRISFNHDVKGTSPRPFGNFVEDRKSLSIGVTGTYQGNLSAGVSYSMFYGADTHNVLADRDFVAFDAKYSF